MEEDYFGVDYYCWITGLILSLPYNPNSGRGEMKLLPLNVAKLSSIINVQLSNEAAENAHSPSNSNSKSSSGSGSSSKSKSDKSNHGGVSSDKKSDGNGSPRAVIPSSASAPTAPSSSSSVSVIHRSIKPHPSLHAGLTMEATEIKLNTRKSIPSPRSNTAANQNVEQEMNDDDLESPTPEVTSFLDNSDNSSPEGGRMQATPKDAFNLTTAGDTSGSHKKQGYCFWGGQAAALVIEGSLETHKTSMGGGFSSPMKPTQASGNININGHGNSNGKDSNGKDSNVDNYGESSISNELESNLPPHVDAAIAVGSTTPRLRSSHAGRAKHAQERRDTKRAVHMKSKAENVEIQMILERMDNYNKTDLEKHMESAFNFNTTPPPPHSDGTVKVESNGKEVKGNDGSTGFRDAHPPISPVPSLSTISPSPRNRNTQNVILSGISKAVHGEHECDHVSPEQAAVFTEQVQKDNKWKVTLDISLPTTQVYGNDSTNVRGALHHSSHQTHNKVHNHHTTGKSIYHHDKPVKINRRAKDFGAYENAVDDNVTYIFDNDPMNSTINQNIENRMQNNSPSAKYPQLSLMGDKKILSTTKGIKHQSVTRRDKDSVSPLLHLQNDEESIIMLPDPPDNGADASGCTLMTPKTEAIKPPTTVIKDMSGFVVPVREPIQTLDVGTGLKLGSWGGSTAFSTKASRKPKFLDH